MHGSVFKLTLVKAAAQAGDNIRRVPTGAAFPAREVLEGVVQIVCPYIGRSADEGCAIKFWEAHMASARPAAFLFDLDGRLSTACTNRLNGVEPAWTVLSVDPQPDQAAARLVSGPA
jgi:hypothetical protein